MKSSIDALRQLAEKFEDGRRQLGELNALETRLRAEEAAARAHLGGLGPEQLAAVSEGGGHFDEATQIKLRSLSDVQTKLDLLPGVRANCRAVVAALRPKVQAATDDLSRHCEADAEAKLKALHAKLMQDLAPVCGAGTARLKTAVLGLVLKSDCEQWRLTFLERARGDDPAAVAEDRIALAEQFQQGALCPHASDQGNEMTDMGAAVSARGRF